MLVSISSVSLGVLMALIYQFVALRSQMRLARDPGAAQGLIFVAELLLRFALVGAVLAAMQRWTSLEVVPAAVGFMAAFVILQAFTLYRYATGRGPFDSPASNRGATPSREAEQDREAQKKPRRPDAQTCGLDGALC